MIVKSISLEINSFDNADTQEDRDTIVCNLLRRLADCVQENGIADTFNNHKIIDAKANTVGYLTCRWEEGDDE